MTTRARAPQQMNIFGGVERARTHTRSGLCTPSPRGFAAQPGTGPAGETCGTCGNCRIRQLANTYYKCGLMVASWTGGRASDITLRSPACSKWVAGSPRPTSIQRVGEHDV